MGILKRETRSLRQRAADSKMARSILSVVLILLSVLLNVPAEEITESICNDDISEPLMYGVDVEAATEICCFNRHYAEPRGYASEMNFYQDLAADDDAPSELNFYDSVDGKLLFTAPVGRSFEEWEEESVDHGWPSFRDDETNMDNVEVLDDGEVVAKSSGAHLGHNLPDEEGNRYCINLVCIAGEQAA